MLYASYEKRYQYPQSAEDVSVEVHEVNVRDIAFNDVPYVSVIMFEEDQKPRNRGAVYLFLVKERCTVLNHELVTEEIRNIVISFNMGGVASIGYKCAEVYMAPLIDTVKLIGIIRDSETDNLGKLDSKLKKYAKKHPKVERLTLPMTLKR